MVYKIIFGISISFVSLIYSADLSKNKSSVIPIEPYSILKKNKTNKSFKISLTIDIFRKKQPFDMYKYPIHYAIFNEKFQLLQKLLNLNNIYYAVINQKSEEGITPLNLLIILINLKIDRYKNNRFDESIPEIYRVEFSDYKQNLEQYVYYMNILILKGASLPSSYYKKYYNKLNKEFSRVDMVFKIL